MEFNKKLSSKEKKEVAFILGAVLIVAVVGVSMEFYQGDQTEAIAGAAVKLNPNLPTYPGMLIYLRDYCTPVTGSGSCDVICGMKTCVPIERNCNIGAVDNQCFCCSDLDTAQVLGR